MVEEVPARFQEPQRHIAEVVTDPLAWRHDRVLELHDVAILHHGVEDVLARLIPASLHAFVVVDPVWASTLRCGAFLERLHHVDSQDPPVVGSLFEIAHRPWIVIRVSEDEAGGPVEGQR